MRLRIEQTWDGKPADAAEHYTVDVRRYAGRVRVEVDAPFFDDPAPRAPAGRLDRLWEFEVVELFLLGADERYFELELGPHGHYLALTLSGRRQVTDDLWEIDYDVRRASRRWHAGASFAAGYLPAGIHRGNACAIHGPPDRRRYLAAFPVGGVEPDFHRLDAFGAIDLDATEP